MIEFYCADKIDMSEPGFEPKTGLCRCLEMGEPSPWPLRQWITFDASRFQRVMIIVEINRLLIIFLTISADVVKASSRITVYIYLKSE